MGNNDTAMRAGNAHAHVVTAPQERTCRIHLRQLAFVEPAGLVTIAAVAERARSQGRFVDFQGPDPDSGASRYMHRMGMENIMGELGVPSDLTPARRWDTGDNLLELRRFRADGFEWDKLADDLFGKLRTHVGTDFAVALYQSIAEIGANVPEHSRASHGYIAMQYYPEQHSVQFAVADAGIGIRASLELHHQVPSDIRALSMAATMGVSGTGEKGRGRGIAGVIARSSKAGQVTLWSGTAHGTTRSGAAPGANLQVRRCQSVLEGTVVAVSIKTEN